MENALESLLANLWGRQMNSPILDDYDPQGFYCEMLRSDASQAVRQRLTGLSIEALKQRQCRNV